MPIDDAPLRGPADALVTIVVASEFQCPFCKRVEPTLQALAQAFPGQVRFAWKHQPLPGHAHALPAAVAAEEARAQGGDAKFWAMHDKLFEIAPALERATSRAPRARSASTSRGSARPSSRASTSTVSAATRRSCTHSERAAPPRSS